jgi:hypothetical protein
LADKTVLLSNPGLVLEPYFHRRRLGDAFQMSPSSLIRRTP